MGREIPLIIWLVSTHSRPKAAGRIFVPAAKIADSFNTQPPEGGWKADRKTWIGMGVSTHSRPKAAGTYRAASLMAILSFQHTAARRRLATGSGSCSPK